MGRSIVANCTAFALIVTLERFFRPLVLTCFTGPAEYQVMNKETVSLLAPYIPPCDLRPIKTAI